MRFILAGLLLSLAGVAPASADVPAFAGPAGWSPSGTPASGVDAAHQALQWHLAGDTTATVTYLRTATSYDDSLSAIHTNFTTNKIKPAVDKDVPCLGKTAHVIEFATGPDAHKIVINRMLVPTPDGVAAITYSRAEGATFDPDVQKAETTFCTSPS